jgi:MscS family membrane protein
MSTHFRSFIGLLLLLPACLFSQAAVKKPASDPLNRTSPRSSVTAFLQACQRNNFAVAAEYLDLKELPEKGRASEGPQLARKLEAILNSDSRFDVLQLSQAPEGNLSDDSDPTLENVGTVTRDGKSVTLQLERVNNQGGAQIWLFSPSTVAAVPFFTPANTTAAVESRLPVFMVSIHFLDTPIWKWIALLIVVCIIVGFFRLTRQVLVLVLKNIDFHSVISSHRAWIQSLLRPWLVFLSAMVFGLAEQVIDPSAVSRLYIGRAILLVVVWAFAWCFINIIDLFLTRVDSLLDPRQRLVSHSLIYMGRRTAKVAIAVLAAIVILDNWGYNMTTMIAGLGVGGIAVALAAQGTIANVFGGISVIADHPVMVGDFGNFGGIIGTVEDIGMRSTRVRTLNRTMMSIPNSSFAGMNLENYALRDKILFNPTLPIKRGTPKEKMQHLIESLEAMLKGNKHIEIGPSPIRLSALTATTMSLEIFAYTLTSDIDEFYKIEAELFLDIDATLISSGIELA